jgi:hypothetical protein
MLSYSFTHSNVCIKIIDRILHEFQSKVLKEEWEEHQKYMIAKKDKRRLEEFHAKFSDINTALQFDVNRIDRKLVSITFKGETEAACLGQRTNVALCFKSKAGDKCDEYIKALEKCFGDAVVLKKL